MNKDIFKFGTSASTRSLQLKFTSASDKAIISKKAQKLKRFIVLIITEHQQQLEQLEPKQFKKLKPTKRKLF